MAGLPQLEKIMDKLHLIEPTLFDQTGHGFSYTSSLFVSHIYIFIDNCAGYKKLFFITSYSLLQA